MPEAFTEPRQGADATAERLPAAVKYRPAIGFEGYRVGNDGSVWSCWKKVFVGRRRGTRRVISNQWFRLKPKVRKNGGHLEVTLRTSECQRKSVLVHYLVLTAFVGPRPSGMVCRHFPDRDTANNRVENLRWGTVQQNSQDRYFHGTVPVGVGHKGSKMSEQSVRDMRADREKGIFIRDLAKKYGVSKSLAHLIVNRVTWNHVD